MTLRVSDWQHSQFWICFRTYTGWSRETVDCSFSERTKILKSAITQWFSESLYYREVLGFWCFKSVRCSELLQYRVFAALYKTWTFLFALKCIQTPQTYIHFTNISRRFRTTVLYTYTHIHSIHTNRRSQTPNKAVRGCVAFHVDIEWCLLVCVGVIWCL